MPDQLSVGLRGEATTRVAKENTATHWGSGVLYVFSTPHMIALMECAAVEAVDAHLPEGCHSVGTLVNVRHLASTPIGNSVKAYATLTGIEGRRLAFDVVAYSGDVKIGEGNHERAIVDVEPFMAKTNARRDPQ